jgi:hypothetical protein
MILVAWIQMIFCWHRLWKRRRRDTYPKGLRHKDDETGKCFPITTCPPGQHFDLKVNKCVPNVISCPKGQHYDTNLKRCIPDCPKDQHFTTLNKCIPDCQYGFHLENKVCIKTIIKRVTTVETVVRNFVTNNQPARSCYDTCEPDNALSFRHSQAINLSMNSDIPSPVAFLIQRCFLLGLMLPLSISDEDAINESKIIFS